MADEETPTAPTGRVDVGWERPAALTGVAFVALAVASAAVVGDSPDFLAQPPELAQFFTDKTDQLLLSAVLGLIATFFLLWFVGTLASRLARFEGARRLAGIALAGGTAAAALSLAGHSAQLVAALRADERGTIDPQVATVLFDLTNIFIEAAAPIGFAVLLAASAVAGLRAGALPKWLCWLGAIIALALAITPIAFLALLAFAIWVLLASVTLFAASPAGADGDSAALTRTPA